MTPPIGRYPEDIPLAIGMRSGFMPYRSEPNQWPVRPKPQITSSPTSRISHPAGALDGLGDEWGDAILADLVDLRRQGSRRLDAVFLW